MSRSPSRPQLGVAPRARAASLASRATKLLFAGALAFGATRDAHAQPRIDTVEVTSARLRVSDVVKDAPSDVASADLGPSPAPSGSRVLTRADLTRLLRDVGYTGKAPTADSVRIVRKMRHMDAEGLETEVRKAVLPKGVTIALVRAPRTTDVPEGFDHVTIDLGKLQRRAGTQVTTARAIFLRGEESLATVPVPVELTVSALAAKADLSRGSPLTVIVRRGGVEITAAGVAGADADVGGTLPVTIRETGRVIKAQLIEPSRAILVEAP